LELKREVITEFGGKSILTFNILKNVIQNQNQIGNKNNSRIQNKNITNNIIINKNIKLNQNTIVAILNSRSFKSIATQNYFRATHIVNFSSTSYPNNNDKKI
jgi:hypothetical protein